MLFDCKRSKYANAGRPKKTEEEEKNRARAAGICTAVPDQPACTVKRLEGWGLHCLTLSKGDPRGIVPVLAMVLVATIAGHHRTTPNNVSTRITADEKRQI